MGYKLSSRAQQLADMPESQFEELLAGETGRPSSERIIQRAKPDAGNGEKYRHLDRTDGYEPYGTPEQYLEAARATLGGIDLDPASSAIAQERVQAARYYTKEEDGLAHDWAGTVWLNPPYGALMAQFLDKLVHHYDAGEVTAGIILVSLHAISAGWTALLFDANLMCFTDHRIPFKRDDGQPPSTPYGSVFAYYGPSPALFAEHFDQFGYLLTQYREDT
jgi:ParB family chromosome partitioning protein